MAVVYKERPAMPTFPMLFGRAAEVVATAPGRVNLIGEHTDYNDGLVLPTAVPQQTTVELARRRDDRVRIASMAVADGTVREYRLGGEAPTGEWLDYAQGCTRMLAERVALGGFDALVASTLPLGSGLSSSAALEVALLRALRTAFAVPLDDVALAILAHRAEHDFVGARVGVMDQMAASLADTRTALFLDARSLAHERVALPAPLALVVVDSGIAHRHVAGGYNVRRDECERAAALLGVPSLRDLGAGDMQRVATLPAPLDRRVRHVITENARVRDAVAALRTGDLAALGAFFVASHASMRDDFAVSLPELDTLVEIAIAQAAVYGARLTGGGFGGSVVIAVRADADRDLGERIAGTYRSRTGAPGRVLVNGTAAR
jgi:galactokinase